MGQETSSTEKKMGTSYKQVLISQWLRNEPASSSKLESFFRAFPKGGDIHSHLSGAIYTEDYLQWGAENGYLIDQDLKALPPLNESGDSNETAGVIPLSNAIADEELVKLIIDRWTTENPARFNNSGHNQFFEAFSYFGAISAKPAELQATVLERAYAQNIQYLELMLSTQSSSIPTLAQNVDLSKGFEKAYADIQAQTEEAAANGSKEITGTRNSLYNHLKNSPAADVDTNYILQTIRTRSPEEVFAQTAINFMIADRNQDVVAINFVAPEDNPTSLKDYSLHMNIVGYFADLFPNVNITLHAGELAEGVGSAEAGDLTFHIREAIEIAGAQRIGHGVDLVHEDEYQELLKEMAEEDILVEICLSSNEIILGISGKQHPFTHYLDAGVPATLASDDEGVSRKDLTHEYSIAHNRYDLTYADIRQLAENSLRHSFLTSEEKAVTLATWAAKIKTFEKEFIKENALRQNSERIGIYSGTPKNDQMPQKPRTVYAYGFSGNDYLRGNQTQSSTLNGGAGTDLLIGGRAADVITGGKGADLIEGKAGSDILTGEKGSDIYTYAKPSDSTASRPDLIELTKNDAISLKKMNDYLRDEQNFSINTLGEQRTFTGNRGDLLVKKTGVYIDLNGDRQADFEIRFQTLLPSNQVNLIL